MDVIDQAIHRVLIEKIGCSHVQNLTGSPHGVLNQCFIFETDKGKFFVKVNGKNDLAMYEAEANGLKSLKETHTLRVPVPHYWAAEGDHSFLIMEYIQLKHHTPSSQQTLGRLLAKMHLVKGPGKFGYEIDNTIGTTPQINTWNDNWVEFFLTNRLEFQLRLLERTVGDTEILRKGEKFIEQYSAFFEGLEVVPSLLHGDLWSGNTAADEQGEPVIYDPAVYYGHHEADFGILLLFGGFSQEFHEAYREIIPMAPGFEERQLGYQLYHYLNHYNLFGSSYRPSCMQILSRLT